MVMHVRYPAHHECNFRFGPEAPGAVNPLRDYRFPFSLFLFPFPLSLPPSPTQPHPHGQVEHKERSILDPALYSERYIKKQNLPPRLSAQHARYGRAASTRPGGSLGGGRVGLVQFLCSELTICFLGLHG